VAVVTAALAKELFGTIDCVGERFGFDRTASAKDWTIIGVVADARINGVRSTYPAMFFVPETQFDPRLHFIAVRVRGNVDSARKELSDAIAAVEPRLRGAQWKTLRQRASDGMGENRAASSLAAVIAGIALLLAGIGTSASLSYLVLTKRKELAIRLAIGASPRSLVTSVLSEAARLTAWGAALGLVLIGCIHLAPSASSIFAKTFDIPVNLAATAVVLVVSLIAALFPALHAAKTDPLTTLKAE
jgi:ABC-type lipoprotein release transport system permease subunit